MNDVQPVDVAQILRNAVKAGGIEQAERELMHLPQADCPVAHYFGPSIYIREVRLPAGILAIGHRQKHEHMNIMVKGRVLMVGDNGEPIERCAPLIYVGKPGRKIGVVLEDVVWQNIYATDERDVEKLEAMLLDKSPAFLEADAQRLLQAHDERQRDREDFACVLEEYGFDLATAVAQSENESDQNGWPDGIANVVVSDSPIHGKGIFCSAPVEAGEVIAPARIGGMRTPAGRYTNHSAEPNAAMVMDADGDINLVALRPIGGMRGGIKGEEVTVNYRRSLETIGVKKCLR